MFRCSEGLKWRGAAAWQDSMAAVMRYDRNGRDETGLCRERVEECRWTGNRGMVIAIGIVILAGEYTVGGGKNHDMVELGDQNKQQRQQKQGCRKKTGRLS